MTLFGFAGPFPGNGLRPGHLAYGESAARSGAAGGTLRALGDFGACAAADLALDGRCALALQGGPVWHGSGTCRGRPRESAASLLAAYRRHGAGLFSALRGRFAIAIVDAAEGRVHLAVDPIGIERLAWALVDGCVVFSSSAELVARFPGRQPALDLQSLFDYLYCHCVPAPRTAFSGVRKLEGAAHVAIESGRASERQYWRPQFAVTAAAGAAELGEELHAALQAGVEDARPEATTGAFLSGGLDSSTVTGMLARVSGRPPATYSIGFDVERFNEIRYARIAAGRFGADAHEYFVTPADVVESFTRIARAYDEPFGNSSAVPTYFCARLAAADGAGRLLAGDGGDELFAGNERYAQQRVFEHYRRVPAFLRRALVEPLALRLPRDSRIAPLRKLRSYVEQARIPLPERLEYWNLLYAADLEAMLEPGFRAAIDPRAPLAAQARRYESAPSATPLHRMLYLDWQFTLADNDIRKVSSMCELAGIAVDYPMLHPDVVEASLRIPPGLLMRGGRLRHFYKEAMRGFLPAEILHKPKHGFGLPFAWWLRQDGAFAEMIYSLLSDLRSRRLVRAGFLERLIADQRAGDASYFGYAIWDLAMLEAWLAAHAP